MRWKRLKIRCDDNVGTHVGGIFVVIVVFSSSRYMVPVVIQSNSNSSSVEHF